MFLKQLVTIATLSPVQSSLNFSFKDLYPPDKIFWHAYFNVAEVLIK